MDNTATVLHNSGLNISAVFTAIYHIDRLSVPIGIKNVIIIYIELSVILSIKFLCLCLMIICVTQQAESLAI